MLLRFGLTVLLPTKAPNANFTELNDLQEVHTMLAERVKQWTQEWRQEVAAKLFLLLLESKFGEVSHRLQEKVRTASPELVETWTKQIFQVNTPEELLDS
ncbi:MAG: DUF4351 domain-containing protein [Methylococcales bacterium]|nr:DUF4351 domain-containing protein [Methylococcales bacterium]